MPTMTKSKTEYGVVEVELSVPINAGRERVWKALVEEPGRWWPKDFLTSDKTKTFVIEPKVGGRVYEDAGNGAGTLWYTVVGLRPGEELLLAGHLFPNSRCEDAGGPSTTMLKLNLEDDGNKTILRLLDMTHGRIGEKTSKSLQSGWKVIFADNLKRYVESAKQN